jgi:hypothetical protein
MFEQGDLSHRRAPHDDKGRTTTIARVSNQVVEYAARVFDSLPDDLYEHSLLPPSVKFAVKDLFPGAKI